MLPGKVKEPGSLSVSMMTSVSSTLVDRVNSGEVGAVARAISKIEDATDGAAELMKQIYPLSRGGLVIGITGAPGAGKSSLVDKLALLYRQRGERVGIVAVDPSSPFSGGAILGDRIRMQALGLDKNVFIRSMATRGNLGGLARATVDAVAILDAAGYSKIIVETAGVGQDEVEIVKAADVSVVVLVPEWETTFRRSRPESWKSVTSLSSIRQIAMVFTLQRRRWIRYCRSRRARKIGIRSSSKRLRLRIKG